METLDKAYSLILTYFKVTKRKMQSNDRSRPIVIYRHMASKWLWECICKNNRISQGYLAKNYFNRDHTTLIHSLKLLDNYRDTNDPLWAEYESLCNYMASIMVSNDTCHPCEYPTLYPVFFKNQTNNKCQDSTLAVSA